jgi:hypothetical protein
MMPIPVKVTTTMKLNTVAVVARAMMPVMPLNLLRNMTMVKKTNRAMMPAMAARATAEPVLTKRRHRPMIAANPMMSAMMKTTV